MTKAEVDRAERMTEEQWNALAKLGELRAVIDPQDVGGQRNATIDRLQWRAIKAVIPTRGRLLDFGCGTGRFARRIRELGLSYTGVDTAFDLLRFARGKHGDSGVNFVYPNATHLPFADAHFDVCIVCMVFQYLSNTPRGETTLREIHRVLAPGGRLVMIEQASLSNRSSGSVAVPSTEGDYIRQLTPLFSVTSISTVRLGGFSKLTRKMIGLTARLRFVTSLMLALMARLEAVRGRRASLDLLRALAYYDIRILAVKK
jgi:SAM-dependent methyltransferase